jgi:hypothetical protein
LKQDSSDLKEQTKTTQLEIKALKTPSLCTIEEDGSESRETMQISRRSPSASAEPTNHAGENWFITKITDCALVGCRRAK